MYKKDASDVSRLRAELSSSDRWRLRLQSLDEATQKRISQKYYGGRMPWREIK